MGDVRSTSSDDRLERLDALVRAERTAFIAVARSEGLGAEDALECVQDALCTFLDRDGDPADPLAVASVKTMARNAARNRRRRHHRRFPHDELGAHPLEAAAEPSDDLVARAEDIVRLRACVAELCAIQREVVMLRLLEERPGEDVAEALGLTRGHVDVLVHRAKSALRACMTR